MEVGASRSRDRHMAMELLIVKRGVSDNADKLIGKNDSLERNEIERAMDGCDDGAELRLEDAIAFRKRRIGREQVGKQEGRKGWWNGASECCRFRTLRRKRSFRRRKRRRGHGGHELFEGRLTGNEGLDILGRCSELRIDFLQRGRR